MLFQWCFDLFFESKNAKNFNISSGILRYKENKAPKSSPNSPPFPDLLKVVSNGTACGNIGQYLNKCQLLWYCYLGDDEMLDFQRIFFQFQSRWSATFNCQTSSATDGHAYFPQQTYYNVFNLFLQNLVENFTPEPQWRIQDF